MGVAARTPDLFHADVGANGADEGQRNAEDLHVAVERIERRAGRHAGALVQLAATSLSAEHKHNSVSAELGKVAAEEEKDSGPCQSSDGTWRSMHPRAAQASSPYT